MRYDSLIFWIANKFLKSKLAQNPIDAKVKAAKIVKLYKSRNEIDIIDDVKLKHRVIAEILHDNLCYDFIANSYQDWDLIFDNEQSNLIYYQFRHHAPTWAALGGKKYCAAQLWF